VPIIWLQSLFEEEYRPVYKNGWGTSKEEREKQVNVSFLPELH
jgi:hypothetical protein